MKKSDWNWMPHPAHFICSKDCKFFLATEVGGYVVSTVGEYYPDSQVRKIHAEIHDEKWYRENMHKKGDEWDRAYMEKFGFTELHIGGWLYETMVFKSEKMPEEGCDACRFKIESGNNIDEEWYKTSDEAFEGHYALCEKWSKLSSKK